MRQVREILPLLATHVEGIVSETKATADDPETPYDWAHNPLRDHSAKALGDAMGRAITELTGQRYTVTIATVNFEPGLNGRLSGNADAAIRIERIEEPWP